MNKKERAICWIERELRFLRDAPRINGCEMKPDWAEQIDVWETALDALKTVLALENKGGEKMCSICGFTSCPPGCPNHPDPVVVCPVCGRECEDLYVTATSGDVVGCDQCVRKKDALDVMQESL